MTQFCQHIPFFYQIVNRLIVFIITGINGVVSFWVGHRLDPPYIVIEPHSPKMMLSIHPSMRLSHHASRVVFPCTVKDMMRALRSSILFFAVLAFTGCAAVQVSQDYDPHADMSRYGTWQWRDPVQRPTGDIRIDNPLLDKRIRQAVEAHLRSRNIGPAQGRPDLYLTYHLTIEQKIQSDSYYSTVGVGSVYHPWYGGIGTETRIRQYDESRLTIDIHSADTGALMWRGVGVFRLRTHKTPEDAGRATRNIVDKILIQFPPGARQ